MGVSFTYRTNESVSDETRASITEEANSMKRSWTTTESIIFFDDPECPDRLTGDSKIFIEGLAETLPGNGGVGDTRFIIEKLCEWSTRFGLSWHITAEGADIGDIRAGKADEQVMGMVESFEDPEIWSFDY